MEFSIPLPAEFIFDSSLGKQWTEFVQRFGDHCKASEGEDSIPGHSSILLFAAQQKTDMINAYLYNKKIDLSVAASVLEIVESVCLPNFLLLFERFRYFSCEQTRCNSVEDFIEKLQRQVDLCQFGVVQESALTNSLISSVSDTELKETLERKTSLSFDDAVKLCRKDLNKKVNKKNPKASVSRSSSSVGMIMTRRRALKNKVFETVQEVADEDLYVDDLNINDEDLKSIQPEATQPSKAFGKRKRQKANQKTLSLKLTSKRKTIKCFACTKELKTFRSFCRHVSRNHATTGFYCIHCDMKFENKKACFDHCIDHTKNKVAICGGKTKKISKKMKVDKSYICWNCGYVQADIVEYRRHCQSHHLADLRVYTCDICQKRSHSISRMAGHLKGHLVGKVKCDVCGVCFAKPEFLEIHRQTHVDKPKYECQICSKSFVTENRLQKHMGTHSGEKRYTCELCGKAFAQKMSFQYHQRWHSGEKPYECDICGHRTISFGDLKKHKQMHSEKTHVCEVCGKAFRFTSNLNRHRKGHSGLRSYSCKICGRSFIYTEGLRDHIKAGRCPGMKSGKANKSRKSLSGRETLSTNLNPDDIINVPLTSENLEVFASSQALPNSHVGGFTHMPLFTNYTTRTILNTVNLSRGMVPPLISGSAVVNKPTPSLTSVPSSQHLSTATTAASSVIHEHEHLNSQLQQQQFQHAYHHQSGVIHIQLPPDYQQQQDGLVSHDTVAASVVDTIGEAFSYWPQHIIHGGSVVVSDAHIAKSESSESTGIVIVPQYNNG